MIRNNGNGELAVKWMAIVLVAIGMIVSPIVFYFVAHSAVLTEVTKLQGEQKLQDKVDVELKEKVDTLAAQIVQIKNEFKPVAHKIDSMSMKVDLMIQWMKHGK